MESCEPLLFSPHRKSQFGMTINFISLFKDRLLGSTDFLGSPAHRKKRMAKFELRPLLGNTILDRATFVSVGNANRCVFVVSESDDDVRIWLARV